MPRRNRADVRLPQIFARARRGRTSLLSTSLRGRNIPRPSDWPRDRSWCGCHGIFGACQPDRLADFKDLGSDGLLQRFITLVIAAKRLSEPKTIVIGQDKINQAIDLLMEYQHREIYLTTFEGSDLIRETEVAALELSEITDYGKTFQGFCNKLHGLHARLAFLLHLLEDPGATFISTDTIERAGRLAMFCVGHARAFYSRTPSSVLEITKDVAGHILNPHP